MSADELEVEFDPKKAKKVDDDLEIGEVPVVVDGEEEEVEGEDEEGVLEEEINPFGDRWEE
ncbi:MAG: hypothetical protein KBD47_01650 [Candidatus Pacebacteria bacterium]|jgi:hypothetical protein|nr:hypothetical protein [Candidatus Paceibacterota bacterium]